jgi:large subunit ribosomal protein L23
MTDLRHYDVIVSPVITEKSTLVSDQQPGCLQRCARRASKPEIKAAVEALFNVKVKAVNTLVRKGKTKRFRGIVIGRQSDVKKAYRDARRRSVDRRRHRAVRAGGSKKRDTGMALKTFNPTRPASASW